MISYTGKTKSFIESGSQMTSELIKYFPCNHQYNYSLYFLSHAIKSSGAENQNILGWQDETHCCWCPGVWFSIKMSSNQYRKSHCGDKTILRPSYLHNGISYTGKMTSLYWIRALGPCISRPSANMVLTIKDKWTLLFHEEHISTTRAPSQYKDHLSQVWGFPC